jgi:hypothetical protein
MADPKIPQQHPMFPTRDSIKQVVDEGVALLPITTPNQLIALLHMHQNTILHLTRR